MLNILRQPDDVKIIVNGKQQCKDANVRFVMNQRKLEIYLSASADNPEFVCLRWNHPTDAPVKVMGDKWERSYADLAWHSINTHQFLPWYFMVDYGNAVVGCGVMVQPNSFVSFEYDSKGVTGWFDVRCGASGVQLNGRELLIATIVCESYVGLSAFEATKEFCKVMSPNPILPSKPVYGSNNWYYAYGKSSKEELCHDAALIAELAKGNDNPPFMVIDDGWQINSCAGPWFGNEKHGDMSDIAKSFKEIGVRPGIWVRLLNDEELLQEHPEWCIQKNTAGSNPTYLDPSHPDVKAYLKEVLNRISDWGFELLKHDYSTYDMFGDYGVVLNGMITNYGDWSFYDNTKTSAEIVLDFYRLIKQEAKGMMILGCNTISHLCAGLVEINRVGDDTSGKKWDRTREFGVNTLAFRLPQHGSFYAIDADCVGILEDYIPWSLNRQWLKLLSQSGTPLFVSAQPSALTNEMKSELKEAFRINSIQNDIAVPLDWQHNMIPDRWSINDQEVCFDWIEDYYPKLLYSKVPVL